MVRRIAFWTASCQRVEVLSFAVVSVVVVVPDAAFVETVVRGSAGQATGLAIGRGAVVVAALVVDISAAVVDTAAVAGHEVDTVGTDTAGVGIDRRHSPCCGC